MDAKQHNNLRMWVAVSEGIVAAVKAAGSMGVPSGHVYAALMAHGCTLENYEKLLQILTDTKILEKRGHVLFLGSKS